MDDFFLYQSHAEGLPEPAAPPEPSAAPWATTTVDVPALISAAAVVWVQYASLVEVPSPENGWQADSPPPVFEKDWIPPQETVFVPVVTAPPEVSAAPWVESPEPITEEEIPLPYESDTFIEADAHGWNNQPLDPLWPTAPPPFEGDTVNPIVVEAAPEVPAAPWATISPDPVIGMGVVWVQYLSLTEVPPPPPIPWATQDPEPIPGPEYVPEGGTDIVLVDLPVVETFGWFQQDPDPVFEPPCPEPGAAEWTPTPDEGGPWATEDPGPLFEPDPAPEGGIDQVILDITPDLPESAAWATQDPEPIQGDVYVPEGGTDLVYAPPPLDPAAPWATQDPGPVYQTIIQWVQYLALVEVPVEEDLPESAAWATQDPDPIPGPEYVPEGGTELVLHAPNLETFGWLQQDPDPLYLPGDLYYEPPGGTDIIETPYAPPAVVAGWDIQSPDPIPAPQVIGVQYLSMAEFELVWPAWATQDPNPLYLPEEIYYEPQGGTDLAIHEPHVQTQSWEVQDPDPIAGDVYVPEGGTDFVYNPPPPDTTGIGAWCWQNPEPIPGEVYIPEGGTDLIEALYVPPVQTFAWLEQDPDPLFLPETIAYEPHGGTDLIEALYEPPSVVTQDTEIYPLLTPREDLFDPLFGIEIRREPIETKREVPLEDVSIRHMPKGGEPVPYEEPPPKPKRIPPKPKDYPDFGQDWLPKRPRKR